MDILETLKSKYDEEIGRSFSFFEVVSFFIILVATYLMLTSGSKGVWSQLWDMSLIEITFGDDSIISRARVVDYLLSGLVTMAVAIIHKKVSKKLYEFFSSDETLNAYVKRIENNYKEEVSDNQSVRLYLANDARSRREALMKRMNSIKSSAMLSLSIFVSALMGLMGGAVDITVSLIALLSIPILHWAVVSYYTSEVVPVLIYERVNRGESFVYGENL